MKKYVFCREANGERLFVDFTFLYEDGVPKDVKGFFIWEKQYSTFTEIDISRNEIDKLTDACLYGKKEELEKYALYVMSLYVKESAESEWFDSAQEEEYDSFLTMKFEDYELFNPSSPMFKPLNLQIIE